mgnify:CR=1 FL=1
MSQNNEKPTTTARTPEEITLGLICSRFEDEFGHGWKRRLAEVADVPESNVHSWIKAGRMPPWVHRVFKLLIQTSRLRRNELSIAEQIADSKLTGHVVEDGDGYAVYRTVDGVGKLVARGIQDIDTAREIAALPKLRSISKQLADKLADSFDMVPIDGWFTEEDEKLVSQVETWSIPPALAADKDGAEIEDLAEALEILVTEFAAKSK